MINFADVILDLQQGDSGKGKISNSLVQTGDYTHSVRFNGSNNAGHTIYKDGKKIVTHSIPAGVLHGVKSIIGPGCVVNVDHFFDELDDLEDCGIDLNGLVYISKNTHIITSSHLEEDGRDTKIGTTKRGNGPAYRDKYDRKGIRASEVHELQPYLIDVYEEFHGKKGCSVLFEGAQGFYLDVDWGDYPYVTSSHCTVGSAVMNGVPPQKIRKIYGAAKIYETYVGTKKFEPDDPVFEKIRGLGNEYGATTGRPRQCNWLDIDNLVKAARINGVTDLVVSKMDILRSIGMWCLYYHGKKLTFSSEMGIKDFITNQIGSDVTIYWSDNPENL
jgi:adenylosuccinate synthase